MSVCPPDPPAAPQAPAGLRERLRRLGAAGVARPARPDGTAGASRPAPERFHGSGDGVEVVRARYAPDHRHGRCVLGEALEAVRGQFPQATCQPPPPRGPREAARTGAGVDMELERTIWLDTETTGLAGGTGTYAFLVGLAYLDGQTLVTEQFLLRRLSAERHLLATLQDRLGRASHLVTFNGRRFDWPILEARFILARQQPAPVAAHTDLIHPARWLWHRVLGTHRLSTLEAEVLGAPRPDDVPGWRIPAMYVEYLRSADRAILDPILAHNRADLLAMVVLHGEVTRILRDPRRAGVPLDWEGAGVLLARRGGHRQAAGCFERAAEEVREPRARWRILRRLVRQHRLLGEPERICARWEEEAGAWVRPDRYRAHVLEEVAKAQGRRGDLEGARRAAAEALTIARSLSGAPSDGAAQDLSRLVERLRHRLGRLSPAGA